ncbi:hypothetical protein Q0F99_10350 [Rathayibacter oskolensis]|nr:hypothetical protein [Rathayibacter oskolensis]WKK70300.1 hypothetical protein Q0F99_10350 [Rathayibacter oskolensis]
MRVSPTPPGLAVPLHRRPLAAPIAVIIGLHLVGWASLLLIIAPQHLTVGADASGTPVLFGLGLGFAAYGLGMRHAFDADHIAAIDNTTRRLAADGKPAATVGFWFSLGHSSVVVILCALLALGVKSLSGQLDDEDSALHSVTSVVGPTVSGLFLILIGVLNLTAVIGMVRIARRRAATPHDPEKLEQLLHRRGLLARLVDRTGAGISSPRRMYLVGFLFGLGFDTATEIGLLVLAGTASAYALPGTPSSLCRSCSPPGCAPSTRRRGSSCAARTTGRAPSPAAPSSTTSPSPRSPSSSRSRSASSSSRASRRTGSRSTAPSAGSGPSISAPSASPSPASSSPPGSLSCSPSGPTAVVVDARASRPPPTTEAIGGPLRQR